MYDGFTRHKLDDTFLFYSGVLPGPLIPTQEAFERVWSFHPNEYHEIKIHGMPVRTPRWQQAFGRDYHYTGRTNRALPILSELAPLLAWINERIDPRLNGLLLNWYDGKLGHYIGRHRDSVPNMIQGSPIVIVLLGEERMFRLRPWRQPGFVDFPATHGAVFIMPYDTNLAWTHEVPHGARYHGRRISITARAFE